ncbi:hypothetical protein CDAR_589691 [Caerostris darwini]|uniref:Uncharacterized protein n=1 Tax=Caerostris darwini TaxID=1538125 RepID=A0AAV4PIY7_9ARAC|nr:hypothetical protein CDAR_589691 [Caerostris darwini]
MINEPISHTQPFAPSLVQTPIDEIDDPAHTMHCCCPDHSSRRNQLFPLPTRKRLIDTGTIIDFPLEALISERDIKNTRQRKAIVSIKNPTDPSPSFLFLSLSLSKAKRLTMTKLPLNPLDHPSRTPPLEWVVERQEIIIPSGSSR